MANVVNAYEIIVDKAEELAFSARLPLWRETTATGKEKVVYASFSVRGLRARTVSELIDALRRFPRTVITVRLPRVNDDAYPLLQVQLRPVYTGRTFVQDVLTPILGLADEPAKTEQPAKVKAGK